MTDFYNCHVHLFTSRAVPWRTLPLGLVAVARNPVTGPILGRVARLFKGEFGERLAAFGTIGRMESARAIFELLRGYYTDEFRFVALPVDMDHMGAGRAPRPYLEQLEALRKLKEDPEIGPWLLPFVCADPRREGVLDLVRRHVEEHDFAGIKLYPPLGFWPCAKEMDPIYGYAEANGVPVLTHCSRGGIHYRGKIDESLRTHPVTGERVAGFRKGRVTEALSDPDNYRPVLRRFPRLRLCLAHYGGGREWHRYLGKSLPVAERESWIRKVTELLKEHEHVYADVSHLADEPEYLPLIQVLAGREDLGRKILFGSDFYMVQRFVSERQFSLRLRAGLGEAGWRRIAHENPRRFLGRG